MKAPKEILGYFEHMRLYKEATRPGYCPFCKVRYSRTLWGEECPAQDMPRHSILEVEVIKDNPIDILLDLTEILAARTGLDIDYESFKKAKEYMG